MYPKKTRITAVANNKGGVSKTSTALALSSLMASEGKRVLLVDLDAQANATVALGIQPTKDNSLYEALVDKKPLPTYTVSLNESTKFDVVPSCLKMSWIDLQMSAQLAREKILQNALAPLLDQYDEIILDCPPSLALITQCAFAAATDVLIPLTADSFAIEGLKMVINFFNTIKTMINPGLNLMGAVLTQYERNLLSKNAEEGLRKSFGDYLFNTKIRKNVAVGKSQAARQDLMTFFPGSNAAEDYRKLYQELKERTKE